MHAHFFLGTCKKCVEQIYPRCRNDAAKLYGAVFVPFCYYEAAINRLTNAALDPFGKIPEFKYCAIRITLGGEPPQQTSYGGGQILARLE